MPAEPAFRWPVRVYWEDTDAGGVVYHAQYLAFLERARSEWLRARGHGQETLRDAHDLVFAVRAMQVEFLQPARLDDALQVSVMLVQCRHASLRIAQEIHRDGELLLTAQVRIAALSATEFRPKAIPDALLDELRALQSSASEPSTEKQMSQAEARHD